VAKQPFYASRGIAEVLIVHEDRRTELHRRRDDGTTRWSTTAPVAPLPLSLALASAASRPEAAIDWIDGSAEV
jgi:hypothetical protein